MSHDTREGRSPCTATLEGPESTTTLDLHPTIVASAAAVGLDAATLTNFSVRMIVDAINEGTAAYWAGRADQFRAAMSRPGDFPGRLSVVDRQERDAQLAAVSIACRRRAGLIRNPATVRRG